MKNYKKISIIFLIILILLFFSINSYASTSTYVQYENGTPVFQMPSEIYTYLVSDCPHYQDYLEGTYELLICKTASWQNTSRWYIVFLDPATKVTLVSGDTIDLTTDRENLYYRCVDDGTYAFEEVTTNVFQDLYNADVITQEDGSIVFYGACSVPVYESDGSTIFFQGAPLLGLVTKAITRNQVNLEVVLEEILQILPLIIVILVSLVGLRKAWTLLSHILRKS